MFLDVLPFKNDTARLVRVYGDEPCITLPEALPAPEGGTLTITELGITASPRSPAVCLRRKSSAAMRWSRTAPRASCGPLDAI